MALPFQAFSGNKSITFSLFDIIFSSQRTKRKRPAVLGGPFVYGENPGMDKAKNHARKQEMELVYYRRQPSAQTAGRVAFPKVSYR